MAVYFIRAGEDGPVKIGYAADPLARMRGLQTSHHETLKLLRQIDGTPATESWLHKQFANVSIRGEWFSFVPEMLTIEPEPEAEPAPPQIEMLERRIAALEARLDRVYPDMALCDSNIYWALAEFVFAMGGALGLSDQAVRGAILDRYDHSSDELRKNEAASILGVAAEAYRKRLAREREEAA